MLRFSYNCGVQQFKATQVTEQIKLPEQAFEDVGELTFFLSTLFNIPETGLLASYLIKAGAHAVRV